MKITNIEKMRRSQIKALLIFVVCTTSFGLQTKAYEINKPSEYISGVAIEMINIWKRNLVEPLSKIWQPWFEPKNIHLTTLKSNKKNIEEINKPQEKIIGEVLSFSGVPVKNQPIDLSKEEVLAWLKDLFLLQQTTKYNQPSQSQAAAPVVTRYYSSGVTQGLADSLSRSVRDINSTIGTNLDTLEANGVFNTSVLSVDTVNTRVGVGTSSPTDTLSVNGPIYLAQISAPSNTSNRLYNSGGSLYWAGNLIGGASTGNWVTDGTSVWRAGGNVGIGTTSPWGLLSVNASGLSSGAPQFVVGSSTATNFIVANNGNVGVGTANTTQELTVNGDIALTDSNIYLRGGTDNNWRIKGGGTNAGYVATEYIGYDQVFLNPSLTPLMAIRGSSGNIGIGTTTPTAFLSIAGSTLKPSLSIGNNPGILGTAAAVIGAVNSTNEALIAYGVSGQSASIFSVRDSSASALFSVSPTGGTMSGSWTLSGGGNFTISTGSTGDDLLRLGNVGGGKNYYLGSRTDGSFRIKDATASADRFTIDTNGNVGIGTTTPWRTLSVNGTVAMPGLVNDSTGYYVCLNTTTGQMATSTSACGASSERFKENIQDITYGLNEVLGLRPVSFDYKANYIPNAPKQLGFIAEEVDLLVPELVARDDAGQIQGLDYPKFTAILVRAVQEMNAKLDTLVSGMQAALAWFTSDGKLKVQNDICVDDVCVTKEQFKQLLLDSAVGATQIVGSGPEIIENSGEETVDTSADVGSASTTPETTSETPEDTTSTTENTAPTPQ